MPALLTWLIFFTTIIEVTTGRFISYAIPDLKQQVMGKKCITPSDSVLNKKLMKAMKSDSSQRRLMSFEEVNLHKVCYTATIEYTKLLKAAIVFVSKAKQ